MPFADNGMSRIATWFGKTTANKHQLGAFTYQLAPLAVPLDAFPVEAIGFASPPAETCLERAASYAHSESAPASFHTGSPVNGRDLFAGRLDQLQKLMDGVSQRGYHAVLFGERVGKTSLLTWLCR